MDNKSSKMNDSRKALSVGDGCGARGSGSGGQGKRAARMTVLRLVSGKKGKKFCLSFIKTCDGMDKKRTKYCIQVLRASKTTCKLEYRYSPSKKS